MKTTLLLGAITSLASHATAFYGQMAASGYIDINGFPYQYVYLTDYNTGSTYQGLTTPGFNGCTDVHCGI
ncbi:uncharacterized protein N7496_005558 [Penicillium cataractarum]|uniref:Uncharacterized protein n=1 Tax=Penicillium cataractarum TaxID=2100454 RepID=A0A9W9SI52_9EURO|nr:uncharacterized protein N7496_005558 [Penicillium cataractarum]KAJ5378149.1 hypothetical protein N7496_005558 [Penicillium cataractarum]